MGGGVDGKNRIIRIPEDRAKNSAGCADEILQKAGMSKLFSMKIYRLGQLWGLREKVCLVSPLPYFPLLLLPDTLRLLMAFPSNTTLPYNAQSSIIPPHSHSHTHPTHTPEHPVPPVSSQSPVLGQLSPIKALNPVHSTPKPPASVSAWFCRLPLSPAHLRLGAGPEERKPSWH